MLYTAIRMLHLLASLVLGMAVLITNLGVSQSLSAEDRRSLRGMLLIQTAAAVVVALAGAAMWLFLGRPAEFYNANPVFHAKLLLFAALVLLAVPAALHLKATGESTAHHRLPGPVILALRLQLIILLSLPLLAWLMARGIGY
jgi:putative membrane protein